MTIINESSIENEHLVNHIYFAMTGLYQIILDHHEKLTKFLELCNMWDALSEHNISEVYDLVKTINHISFDIYKTGSDMQDLCKSYLRLKLGVDKNMSCYYEPTISEAVSSETRFALLDDATTSLNFIKRELDFINNNLSEEDKQDEFISARIETLNNKIRELDDKIKTISDACDKGEEALKELLESFADNVN